MSLDISSTYIFNSEETGRSSSATFKVNEFSIFENTALSCAIICSSNNSELDSGIFSSSWAACLIRVTGGRGFNPVFFCIFAATFSSSVAAIAPSPTAVTT